jgi:MFS family permease
MKFTHRFPALASRDFLIFWVGQFISLIGSWMQSTTLPYLAYRLSGRPIDLGIIGFSASLPMLFLALPGGVIIERLDKRKVVIVMQTIMMLQAFILAFLALTGLIQIWHIIILAFILGSANAIEITARQAMLVELVGKPALPNAIALQATVFNLARVIGPSLTAVVLLLIQNQSEGWAFFINGVSFLFVIGGLFFVRTPFRTEVVALEHGKGSLKTEFSQGMQFIRGNTLVLSVILLAGMMGFFGFPFQQQIPALGRDILSVLGDSEEIIKARTSSLYIAQGVGALVAALFISSFSNLRRKGLLLTISQYLFAFGLIFISFFRTMGAILPIVAVLGWALVSQLATMNTIVQLEVPNELRGRVFSVYLWALQGVAPFGSLFIGALAQSLGIPHAALISGGICLIILAILYFRFPDIHRLKTGADLLPE